MDLHVMQSKHILNPEFLRNSTCIYICVSTYTFPHFIIYAQVHIHDYTIQKRCISLLLGQ